MKIKNKIYVGTSKTLYESEEEYSLIMSFNDNLKLGNKKVVEIAGKGVINNSISAFLMEKLDMVGIENHLINKLNMRQQLIQFVDALPIQVYVNNIACGRYVEELGIEEGFVFDTPLMDFRVKNSELSYPIVNEEQIIAFQWMRQDEIDRLKKIATRVNDFLSGFFAGIGIRLVETKLEFGRVFDGEDITMMLIDEISPDTCRLWDLDTNQKLCFEVAEDGPDSIISAYQEVLSRLGA